MGECKGAMGECKGAMGECKGAMGECKGAMGECKRWSQKAMCCRLQSEKLAFAQHCTF